MSTTRKRRSGGSVSVYVQEYVSVDLADVLEEISDEDLKAELESRGNAVSPRMRAAAGEQAEDVRDLCERIERLVVPDQRIEAGVLLRELQHAIGLPRISIPTGHKLKEASA